jgi:hypothetical protein
LPFRDTFLERSQGCFDDLAADKKADYSANQSANYGEDYGFLKARGGRSVSPSKNRAYAGENADSFD